MKKAVFRISAGVCILLLFSAAYSLQNSYRDQREKPEILLDTAGVKPGMRIGEAGAGRGYLTFFLSSRVGEKGMVYANDIDRPSLQVLERRIEREGVHNIKVIPGEVADPKFPVNDLDMVVMLHAFHDFTKKEAWLRNVKKYMKHDAPVVIFDRQNYHTDMNKELVMELGHQAGFELVRAASLHNGIWVYILKITTDTELYIERE